jgi:outer membrane protein OmpA-like peptidoglycan-associated protein
MANALFDMDIGSPYVFPYLGFGVGYQSTGLQGFSVTRTAPSGTFSTSARAGGFAAQVIAGLAFPVPNRPGWSITADYRVMDILGGDTFNGASSFGPASGSTKMHNQFDQSAILGVRYAFDTPMPAALVPPAAETPPAQTRSFLVLFGPGSATLDSRASDVVAAAVRDAAQGQKTRVGVAGNADTSGNAAANMALSERRAQVVAAAMIRAGVPKDEIAIQAFGDTKPAVPTGPGIARAENRRVEIVVQ